MILSLRDTNRVDVEQEHQNNQLPQIGWGQLEKINTRMLLTSAYLKQNTPLQAL